MGVVPPPCSGTKLGAGGSVAVVEKLSIDVVLVEYVTLPTSFKEVTR
jgi:hypothetical protein